MAIRGASFTTSTTTRTNWITCSTIPATGAVRAELMEKLAYRQMELADRSPLPMGRA